MSPSTKAAIISALKTDLSNAEDNLYRAKRAASRHDPQKEWGESGRTLQSIIDGYQRWRDEAKAALVEVEAP